MWGGGGTGATAAAHDSVFRSLLHRLVSNKKEIRGKRSTHTRTCTYTELEGFTRGISSPPVEGCGAFRLRRAVRNPLTRPHHQFEGVLSLLSYAASPSSSAPCMWDHIILRIAHLSCVRFGVGATRDVCTIHHAFPVICTGIRLGARSAESDDPSAASDHVPLASTEQRPQDTAACQPQTIQSSAIAHITPISSAFLR